MKILSAEIEEFGCLENRRIEFSDGFNLIVGENESGKSTLLTFIKFILYGMPRKNQETAAERERSVSVKSGRAAGNLTVRLENQETYRIERSGILRLSEKRESYSEECKIIDLESGAQVHKGAIPGELFLGVPAAVFESTCFVRQMKTTEMDGGEVGEALSNMLLSADESIDLQRSLDRIDALRKSLLHKNGKGGSLAVLSAEISDLCARLERAKSDSERIISCGESVESLKRSAAARRQELDRLDDTFTAFNSVAVIKRFETLAELEKKLSACRELLERLNKEHTREGKLPSRELAVAAEAAAKHYRATEEASRDADERLEWAKINKSANKKRHPELDADEIRAVGGIESICADLSAKNAMIDGRKKTVIVFAVFAFAAVIGGAVLALTLPRLWVASVVAFAYAVAMIALCAVTSAGMKKIKAEREALLEKYGLSPDADEARLRALLTAAFEDERRENELENAVSVALSTSELRRSDLKKAEKEADAIINSWRPSETTDRIKALGEIARLARDYFARYDVISRDIELETRRIASLRAELSAYNEADLRARVKPEVLAEYSDSAADELERRRKFCSASLRSISEKQISAERELIRLESESENPSRVAILLEDAEKRYAEEKQRYDAAVAAYEALQAASTNIRDSIAPVIRKRASEYLSAFTDGRYTSIGIENGCIPVAAEGERMRARPELLSAGTRDAIYLSLRLSLLDVLYKDELPPLALDEALSQMDDKRAGGVLSILSDFCREKGQCLLFTCHQREGELLSGNRDVLRIEL